MNHPTEVFAYRNGELYCEEVPIAALCEEYGTPLYVYSHTALVRRYREFASAFAEINPLICFSVKSNGNLAVLRTLANEGAGADIVSGGELFRALQAGIPPERIVFAGPGKTEAEIRTALKVGVYLLNVESFAEAERINHVAQELKVRAPIALRVNPDVDAKTHKHTTTGKKGNKFGIDLDVALHHFKVISLLDFLDVVGVHAHIGSPILRLEPFEEAMTRLVELIDSLRDNGIRIERLDFGGGLGITYRDETPPSPEAYAACLRPFLRKAKCRLILEPGRYISGNSGILCVRVTYRKETTEKTFLITDGAMNDLIRPALYDSYHEIGPVRQKNVLWEKVDVVGPVCESGDFFAKNRELERVEAGDYLAVFSAGAYGFTMSSNYNARPRAAEVLVKGARSYLVRRRETYEDLIRGEQIPEELL